ncbi:uncharacterized membrane protein YhaH (DUF805 family) [Kitasatospora paracochleata]|uniref:Uncharacterized membrane protein YhaH (DUF805 family) n=1 Tax=Kitasatospora paracochleata TaxID=58354 RepID=A0ABT1J8N3_9ACTN|nr:uncharacterized membrane protein YhaH (DUF805 family) [Kitasatospora paracochleata]
MEIGAVAVEWYLAVLKNYAGFSGRARRKEFWMFYLFNLIAVIVLAILDNILGTGFLAVIYLLAVLVPTLAVGTRRLHDTGKSGWLLLLGVVPVANIILLVFCAMEGQPEDNEYGANPKLAPAVA